MNNNEETDRMRGHRLQSAEDNGPIKRESEAAGAVKFWAQVALCTVLLVFVLGVAVILLRAGAG